jgi:hypothetical protein
MKLKRISQKRIEGAEFVLAILIMALGILGIIGFVPPHTPLVAILLGMVLGIMIARIIQRLLSPEASEMTDVSRLEDGMVGGLDEAKLEEMIGILQAELEQRKTKTGT